MYLREKKKGKTKILTIDKTHFTFALTQSLEIIHFFLHAQNYYRNQLTHQGKVL